MSEQANTVFHHLKKQLHKVIVGQDRVLDEILIALMAGGHVLLEGVPGTAKTLLAKTLAYTLNLKFSRIQFTPDLMPADVIGTNIYHMNTGGFSLHRGPIFSEVVLADEINRTPPKTQSALLEAMGERQVTIDGTSHVLPLPFFVIATQNPIEHEGTYPLPEAQLDRFLMKSVVDYPKMDEELEVIRRWHEGFNPLALAEAEVESIDDPTVISECMNQVRGTGIEEGVQRYIVEIVRQTREAPTLQWGASPRAAVDLLIASKAAAVSRGRAYVTPDEVKEMAKPVLRHRVILRPEAEMERLDADRAIETILAKVQVPR